MTNVSDCCKKSNWFTGVLEGIKPKTATAWSRLYVTPHQCLENTQRFSLYHDDNKPIPIIDQYRYQ